ncbi:hypothetical protein KQX54_021833 [Cotesia glomerata]|uniref:Uncharacterized protein n=1 Tax=Cotesia glomerata TaxID=32391 RepID=A0AAV7J7K4_COTGL|nr:hypothetical protein KQX54_021833 [Cotesia glomerata]
MSWIVHLPPLAGSPGSAEVVVEAALLNTQRFYSVSTDTPAEIFGRLSLGKKAGVAVSIDRRLILSGWARYIDDRLHKLRNKFNYLHQFNFIKPINTMDFGHLK